MIVSYATYFRSTAALLVLWLLWYYGFMDLLVEDFRQRLFRIRDKLFDYAAQGNISFDDPAYTHLRSMLNSMLRFAHKVTFCRALLAYTYNVIRPSDQAAKEIERMLEPIRSLPSEKKLILLKFHAELLFAMFMYVLKRSPALWLIAGALIVCIAVRTIARGTLRKLSDILSEALPILGFHIPGIVLIEAQAIEGDNH